MSIKRDSIVMSLPSLFISSIVCNIILPNAHTSLECIGHISILLIPVISSSSSSGGMASLCLMEDTELKNYTKEITNYSFEAAV